MVVRLRKEWFFSLFIFLPYLEGFLGFLSIFKNDVAYYRPINFVLCFISIIVLIVGIKYKPIVGRYYKTELLLPIYLLVSLAWTNINDTTWSTLTWMVTPIFFSIIYSAFFLKNNLDAGLFIKYCILNFCFYSFVNLAHNIIAYHLFLDLSVRLRSAGGGAVIYGYTATIMFTILCAFSDRFNRLEFGSCALILLLSIIGTGSRGAIWLLIPIIALYVVMSRKKSKQAMVFFLFFIPLCFFFLTIAPYILIKVAPRLLQTSDYSRNVSLMGITSLFTQSDLKTKLLGRGLGNVFIYQKWLIQNFYVSEADRYPFFQYLGHTILVQPHNVYFYYAIECGIITVLLFISPFLKYIFKSFKNRNFWLFVLALLILVENVNDSIMIVEPGVAAIIYTMIFVIANSEQLNNNYQEIS